MGITISQFFQAIKKPFKNNKKSKENKSIEENNYQLIKYVWHKNYQVNGSLLKDNHSDIQFNNNIDLFWNIASSLKDNTKLKARLDKLHDKISILSQKQYIHEGLEVLSTYGELYYRYYDGSFQQESVVNFVKQNIEKFLRQGKLEKTRITTKEQADELILKNQETLNQLKKNQSGVIEELIFEEIKRYIDNIHEREQIEQSTQNTQKLQQKVNEASSIMRDNAKKIVERNGKHLATLEETAKNLQKQSKLFAENTKKTSKKYKPSPLSLHCVLIVALVTVTLAVCTYAILSSQSPSYTLDNVAITQGIAALIDSARSYS